MTRSHVCDLRLEVNSRSYDPCNLKIRGWTGETGDWLIQFLPKESLLSTNQNYEYLYSSLHLKPVTKPNIYQKSSPKLSAFWHQIECQKYALNDNLWNSRHPAEICCFSSFEGEDLWVIVNAVHLPASVGRLIARLARDLPNNGSNTHGRCVSMPVLRTGLLPGRVFPVIVHFYL